MTIQNSKFKIKNFLIGIDEAGRGPLAGPIVFGAVAAPKKEFRKFRGIRDSKQLNPRQREEIFAMIKKLRFGFKTVFVSAKTIDKKGLTKVSEIAIVKLLKKIKKSKKAFILLDGGLKAPIKYKFQKTIIKGDEKIPAIALASIVAKVSRDRFMVRLSKKYPVCGFEKHKGYGTKEHYKKIKKYGLCQEHRRSFLKELNKKSGLEHQGRY